MDHQRFDQLARGFASGASRRAIVRGAMGGAGAALLALFGSGRARAQISDVAIGGACTDSRQCDISGACGFPAPVICGENDASPSALTCCVGQGIPCASDLHCCGSLRCTGVSSSSCGTCEFVPEPEPSAPEPGEPAAPSGTLPPGAACTETAECSQEGGAVVCADNRISDDGALNCCRQEGGACADGYGCCDLLLCVDGVCTDDSDTDDPAAEPVSDTETTTTEASDGGLTPGTACASTDQCSQDQGAAICADNGITDDGGLNCCLTARGGCNADAECCTGLVCDDNFVEEDGPLTCCGVEGSSCDDDASCCGFFYCVEGTCQSAA